MTAPVVARRQIRPALVRPTPTRRARVADRVALALSIALCKVWERRLRNAR